MAGIDAAAAALYEAALAELGGILGADTVAGHRPVFLDLLRQTDGRVNVVLNRFLDITASGQLPEPAAVAPSVAPAPSAVSEPPSSPLPPVDRTPDAGRAAPPPATAPVTPVAALQPAAAPVDSGLALSKSSGHEERPRRGPPAAWPRFLGETIVKAYAMVSGRDKLVVGDDITLERAQAATAASLLSAGAASAPPASRFGRPPKSPRDNTIVRLLVRGREVGKLASETARYVAKVRRVLV